MHQKIVIAFFLLLIIFSSAYASFWSAVKDFVVADSNRERTCEVTNCICRFILNDPIWSHVFWDSCGACYDSSKTGSVHVVAGTCTACVSAFVGPSIGCGTYCRTSDRYGSGENYCSMEDLLINVLGIFDPTECGADILGLILGEVHDGKSTIQCKPEKPKEIGLFSDLTTNPQRSEYINYINPPKPTPSDDVVLHWGLYNLGTRRDTLIHYQIKLYKKMGEDVDYIVQDLIGLPNAEDDDILIECANLTRIKVIWPSLLYKMSYDFGQLPEGEYYVLILLDPPEYTSQRYDSSPIYGSERECNNYGTCYEDNNNYFMEFNVSDLRLADFKITNVTSRSDPIAQGGPIEVTATIKNQGHVDLSKYLNPNVRLSWYLNDEPLGTSSFNDLDAGEEITLSRTIRFNSSGYNDLKLMVDSYYTIEEELEDNNVYRHPFYVSPWTPEPISKIYEPLWSNSTGVGFYWIPSPDANVEEYNIYYSNEGFNELGSDEYELINPVLAGNSSLSGFQTNDLQAMTLYWFGVTAVNKRNQESPITELLLVDTGCPIEVNNVVVNDVLSGNETILIDVSDPEGIVDHVSASLRSYDYIDYWTRVGRDNTSSSGIYNITFDTSHISYAENLALSIFVGGENCTVGPTIFNLTIDNNPTPSIDLGGGEISGVHNLCVVSNNIVPDRMLGMQVYFINESTGDQIIVDPDNPFLSNYYPMDYENEVVYRTFEWCTEWNTTRIPDGNYSIKAVLDMEEDDFVYNDNETYYVNNIPDLRIWIDELPDAPINKTINISAKSENSEYEDMKCMEFYYSIPGSRDIYLDSVASDTDDCDLMNYDTRNICKKCDGVFKIIAYDDTSIGEEIIGAESISGMEDVGIQQSGQAQDNLGRVNTGFERELTCSGSVLERYTYKLYKEIDNEDLLVELEMMHPRSNDILHGVNNISIHEISDFINISEIQVVMYPSGSNSPFYFLGYPSKNGDIWSLDFDTTTYRGYDLPDGQYYLRIGVEGEYKGDYEYMIFYSNDFSINNDHRVPDYSGVDLTFYPERIIVTGPRYVDNKITLTAPIKNIGRDALPSHDGNRFLMQVRTYYKEPGSDSWNIIRGGHFNLWSSRGNNEFDSGETIAATMNFTPRKTGEYEFRFAVDTVMPDYSFDYYNEGNEDNNVIVDSVIIREDNAGPDNPFAYFFDRFFENVQKALTFDSEAREKLELRFAEERLAEANNMKEKGRSDLSDELLDEAVNITKRVGSRDLDNNLAGLGRIKLGGGKAEDVPVCGDGLCGKKEDCESCPNDCLNESEVCCNKKSFLGDCCNDYACNESSYCTNNKCVPIVCGDGSCDGNEDCSNCPSDCLKPGRVCCHSIPYRGECCNNSECEMDYSCINHWCHFTGSVCGDGVCDDDESGCTCSWDCGPCISECGDGLCTGYEDCESCPDDCGECECGDGLCTSDEDCSNCPSDCGECICGDGECEEGEDCESCPNDCLNAGEVCCDESSYTGDCCDNSDCESGFSCIDYYCEEECLDENCDICEWCVDNECTEQTKNSFSTCSECIDHYSERLECSSNCDWDNNLDECSETEQDCWCMLGDICSNFCDFLDYYEPMSDLYSDCMNLGYMMHDYDCVI